jgi:hypothetical protein
MEFAACGGMDTNRWFPEYAIGIRPAVYGAKVDPSSEKHAEIRNVIAVCRGCPVREDCESHAIDNKIEDGIWGGRLAKDRRKKPWVLADHGIEELTS